AGEGEGYNVNLPMPHGASEDVFFERVESALRVLRRFQPDALVLALGFDIYKDDPQSKVAVSTEGFGKLGEAIGALGLPSVIVQEGGYHLESLEDNARAFFGGFGAKRAR
ncbi:MAG: histone deacetylase family protein, partial [Paraburkholderia tropica]